MSNPKTAYYASVGPRLKLFEVDVDGAQLHERDAVTLPANIQYAWPHPSRRYLMLFPVTAAPALPATSISPTPLPSSRLRVVCVSTANPPRFPRDLSMPASIAAAIIC